MASRSLAYYMTWTSILLSLASADSSWRPCNSGENYPVTIQNVKVIPDPAVRGGDATFDIPAVSSQTISGGSITVRVYYLGVVVHSQKEDLCIRTRCPVAPGNFSITNSEGLPDFTPTGAYTLDMRMQNENGEMLTCLKINFKIAAANAQY